MEKYRKKWRGGTVEEGVGKGKEDGGKHKEGGLVSDPPLKCATCLIGGTTDKVIRTFLGAVGDPLYCQLPPVGVGGNG